MKMQKFLRISRWQQLSINPTQAFLCSSCCTSMQLALVEGQLGSITCYLFSLSLFPRPGQYLRESTKRGTQKAPLSGRLVCAVLSTRVSNLRRFLRMAIGMALSHTRCIGCFLQEPSLVSVPLPITPRISRLGRKGGDEPPGRWWDSL